MGCAGPTPKGPESTFNYLIDAILAVPELRSMYMRRLRSIMDEYTNGKLADVSPAVSPLPADSKQMCKSVTNARTTSCMRRKPYTHVRSYVSLTFLLDDRKQRCARM